MIISRTPFRISFAGGGTDLAAFYRRQPGAVTSSAIDKYMYIAVNKQSASTILTKQKEDTKRKLDILSKMRDISYEKVFTEQLKVFLEEGDVVLGITASGNSPNILDAIRYAREHGATTIGFIGFGGGKLKALVDVDVTVSSHNYGHVEDVHCILEHLVSQCLRQKIAGA